MDYQLGELDGRIIPRTWNTINLKYYYSWLYYGYKKGIFSSHIWVSKKY